MTSIEKFIAKTSSQWGKQLDKIQKKKRCHLFNRAMPPLHFA
jgi:hypothetical protein